jgi:uncharacterized protein YkwD
MLPESVIIAAPGIDAYETMRYINQERTSRFLPELVTNDKLMTAAAIKSNDMLSRGYFAHVDPDGNYVWPTIEAAGYFPFKTLGENLAMDFSDARTMVNAWMNSPTHRANVLNEKYEDQGLSTIYGMYKNDHNTIVATNLFGALLKEVVPSEEPAAQAPSPTTKPPDSKPVVLPAESETQPTQPAKEPVQQDETKLNLSAVPGQISQVKITPSNDRGNTVLNIEVKITGEPKKVTASLADMSAELVAVKSINSYIGTIKVPTGTVLSQAILEIFIEQLDGAVTVSEVGLKEILTAPQEASFAEPKAITTEKQMSNTIKIILGILAAIFVVFLVIDSVIIHRANLSGIRPHSSPHTLLLLILIVINLFSIFYY